MTTKHNLIANAIYDAHKEQTPIKANIRLKKNGQFSSVEGMIQSVKVSRDGYAYFIVQPFSKKEHVQTVILNNVVSIYKDNILVKR